MTGERENMISDLKPGDVCICQSVVITGEIWETKKEFIGWHFDGSAMFKDIGSTLPGYCGAGRFKKNESNLWYYDPVLAKPEDFDNKKIYYLKSSGKENL